MLNFIDCMTTLVSNCQIKDSMIFIKELKIFCLCFSYVCLFRVNMNYFLEKYSQNLKKNIAIIQNIWEKCKSSHESVKSYTELNNSSLQIKLSLAFVWKYRISWILFTIICMFPLIINKKLCVNVRCFEFENCFYKNNIYVQYINKTFHIYW